MYTRWRKKNEAEKSWNEYAITADWTARQCALDVCILYFALLLLFFFVQFVSLLLVLSLLVYKIVCMCVCLLFFFRAIRFWPFLLFLHSILVHWSVYEQKFQSMFRSRTRNRVYALYSAAAAAAAAVWVCECSFDIFPELRRFTFVRSLARRDAEEHTTRSRELNEKKKERSKVCASVCSKRQRRRFVAFIASATCYNDRQ